MTLGCGRWVGVGPLVRARGGGVLLVLLVEAAQSRAREVDKKESEMAQFLSLLRPDPTGWLKMPADEKQKWFGKYMAWGNQARQVGFLNGDLHAPVRDRWASG